MVPGGNGYDLTSIVYSPVLRTTRPAFVATRSDSFDNLLAVDQRRRNVVFGSPLRTAGTMSSIDAISGRDTPVERHAGDRSLGPMRFGRLTLQTNHFLADRIPPAYIQSTP